jgi:hypothetical protein
VPGSSGPGRIAKTGYSGFLWFLLVAEKFFMVALIDQANLDGHFFKNFRS